jgi:hypothetical protein
MFKSCDRRGSSPGPTECYSATCNTTQQCTCATLARNRNTAIRVGSRGGKNSRPFVTLRPFEYRTTPHQRECVPVARDCGCQDLFILWRSTFVWSCQNIPSSYHAMKTNWESGGTVSCFLKLSARWRWMVSFTPRPLYSGEEPQVSVGQKAGWTPEQVWTWWR